MRKVIICRYKNAKQIFELAQLLNNNEDDKNATIKMLKGEPIILEAYKCLLHASAFFAHCNQNDLAEMVNVIS